MFLVLTFLTNIIAQEDWFWQNPLPQGNPLYDVHIFNSNTAIVVGNIGTVMKTTDGGTSWNMQRYAGGWSNNLYSVHFVDSNIGWAVGHTGQILQTTDGGEIWNRQADATVATLN